MSRLKNTIFPCIISARAEAENSDSDDDDEDDDDEDTVGGT